MSEQSIEARLQEPFPIEDVKWRVQRSGLSKSSRPWVIVQPYITGRAIQTRLDDVFGVSGWEVFQHETMAGDGFVCTLKVFLDGRWVSRQDVAQKTDIEALKGGASGALKRAGALLGIGRYLYRLKPEMATVYACENRYDATNYMTVYEDNKNKQSSKFANIDWVPPVLPDWARPGLDSSQFVEAIKSAKLIISVEAAYLDAISWANSFSRKDLVEMFEKVKLETIETLENQAKDNVATRFAEVNAWLVKEVKNLDSIPDPGAVHKVADRLREKLTVKCQDQLFDKGALYKTLKQAVINRINAIEGK